MDILWFLKNRAYSIGVDIGDDSLNLAQLANTKNGVGLVAGSSVSRPESVKPGSAAWQRWAVEAITKAMVNHKFHGRNVIAAVPVSDVFIDHIKMGHQFTSKPQNRGKMPIRLWQNDEKTTAIFSKIKQKLPFESDDVLIQYISTTLDNVLVMVTDRKIIDRHLAIYEMAGLTVKSIGAWPVALTNCYTKFFGRRKVDLEAIVMLLDIGANYTNLVICRHKNLLFAYSIPMGAKQLDDEKAIPRLVFELTACRRRFLSMLPDAQIERLIFLSGPTVDASICKTIASQMKIKAQIGDCIAAVEISNPYCWVPPKGGPSGIDRRNCNPPMAGWATAFGLSLSIG